MRLRVEPLTAMNADLEARWADLADRAIDPNPNADPRYLLASLGRDVGAETIRLAIVESDDAVELVMPFTIEGRVSGIPARHLSTHGAPGGFTNVYSSKNHPLVGPSDPSGAISALLSGLRRARLPRLLNLTVFPADGPLHDATMAVCAADGNAVVERGRDGRGYARRADLADSGVGQWYSEPGDLLSFPQPHLSSRGKRNLKRARRLIQEQAGPLSLADVSTDPAAIDEFLDLQAAGWKGDEALDGPKFRSTSTEAWFRAVTDRFRATGDLAVYRITAGERTVYMAVNLISGGRQFGFHDVFHEDFRKYSPGTVGRAIVLGALMEPIDAPPFDPAMEAYYLQAGALMPSKREYLDLLVSDGSPWSNLVVRAYPLAKRLRDRVARARASGAQPPAME